MPYRNLILAVLLSWLSALTFASDEGEFLPVNQAFQVTAETAGNHIHFRFTVAEGYYLYKHRFGFEPTAGTPGVLGEPVYLQAGKWKEDPIFGQVEVFYSKVDIYVPVLEAGDGFIEVDARYQGCADKGLCYIPQTYTDMFQIDVNAAKPDIQPETPLPRPATTSTDVDNEPPSAGLKESATPAKKPDAGLTASANSTDLDANDALSLENFLSEAGLFSILGVFFLIGIGLTFTPCVLPMVPILSGIIVGQGTDLSRRKAAALSVTYVLGMAVTYAALGVVAGLTGAKLQVAMQNPTVLFSFAAVFVVLSFSMFGFYELQLPSGLQNKLNNISQQQQGGTYIGVAIIGILSALVVSPCVSAPLAGALLYIGQSGDWAMGGLALLALGLGMGAPLIAIGVTGANILPKAGGWMDNVKGLFGVMLLAVALWLVKHLMPDLLAWVIAGGLCILAGLYLGALDPFTTPKGKLFRGIGLSVLACGVALILSQFLASPAATPGNASASTASSVPFQRIRSEQALDQALAQARANGQPVMIDYFADWCTACFEMEHETFSQNDVQGRLGNHRWLQIDLTNNPEDNALLQRYNLPGPPAILFFDARGDEVSSARIYAYKSKSQFLAHLDQHQIQ
ncbi:protein-disulfide reductase DsbD [Ketobacter sp.]|uniref:protein-disulfide reductase DsbD n=1 Tax=Ketobacter sp. TaxID=2083498 RepID=UPI000F2B4E9E|nr:protein-disulfide reductase DsbD [Ketobacter sp.]RLT92278.1 MAG: protein-disulfide reductase DsbD [Ketobacter sp.]